jgi:dynein heavy chain
MQRLYSSGAKDLETKKRDHFQLKYCSLVYALSFFHSVLLERRKFASLGFNILYDFNNSDWEVSERLIDKYLEQAQAHASSPDAVVTPWDAIRYLVAEANYGLPFYILYY